MDWTWWGVPLGELRRFELSAISLALGLDGDGGSGRLRAGLREYLEGREVGALEEVVDG